MNADRNPFSGKLEGEIIDSDFERAQKFYYMLRERGINKHNALFAAYDIWAEGSRRSMEAYATAYAESERREKRIKKFLKVVIAAPLLAVLGLNILVDTFPHSQQPVTTSSISTPATHYQEHKQIVPSASAVTVRRNTPR